MDRIDFKDRRFKGVSGQEYKILGSITVGRYQAFQVLQLEMAYGSTVRQLANGMHDTYELLNKGKPADAAVKLYNYRAAISRIDEGRNDPMLYLCSLFCVTDGEDLSRWEILDADEKIKDWANIAVEDFFSVAASSVPGLVELWVKVSQSISDQQEAAEVAAMTA